MKFLILGEFNAKKLIILAGVVAGIGNEFSAAEGSSKKFSSVSSKFFKIYHPHQKYNFEQKVLFWYETDSNLGKKKSKRQQNHIYFNIKFGVVLALQELVSE